MNEEKQSNNDILDDAFGDSEEIEIVDTEEFDEIDEEEIITDESVIENENFDEVLQLTEYNDSLVHANNDSEYNIAEYKPIETVNISNKHKKFATAFVKKITGFVLEFNDVVLTEKHKKYLTDVGKLQIQHLEDLLSLTDMNKQMISNIVARVNATQAEDYVIINSYNNLINQHLKLIKELQNSYKSIPTIIKKMKTEILCNQELGEHVPGEDEELITEDFGTNQVNNSKQLHTLLKNRKEAQEKIINEKNSDNNEENTNSEED